MYQRILVPIDGSDTAKLGLEESVRLAKSTGGRLRLIHVITIFLSPLRWMPIQVMLETG